MLGETLGKMHPALSDGEPGIELMTFMQMYIDELRISARDIELELIENPVRIEDDAWQIIRRTINIRLGPQYLPQIADIYNDLVRTASWLRTIRGRLQLAKAESYFSE